MPVKGNNMAKKLFIIKILLGVIILLNTNIFPQTQLNGFWDLKWGDSLNKVKSFMKNKAKFSREMKLTDYHYLEYTAGMFVNLEVEIWSFKFSDNKLYEASVGYKIPSMLVYNKLVEDISNKYGNPIEQEKYVSEWLIQYTSKGKQKFSRVQCNAGNGTGFEEGIKMIWLNYSDEEMSLKESNKIKKRRKEEL